MAHAPYRIYAVRYAHRECTTTNASTATTTRRPWPWTTCLGPHQWNETVVVTWASPERWAHGEVASSCAAPEGLAESALTAPRCKHVILSHCHYDHVGKIRALP